MSYLVLSCLITWTLMQLTLRPKVLSPCCRCAGIVLVAQKMLKVKIELTWAPSLALQVCIRLVDGRHLCCYGRRQAMEPLHNFVMYLLRLVDGHFSSLFHFHNLSLCILCSGKSLIVIFLRRKDFCMRPELWGPQLWSWDFLEHGATGRPRFEYNYSDPSHPDSKSPMLDVFHRNQVVMLRVTEVQRSGMTAIGYTSCSCYLKWGFEYTNIGCTHLCDDASQDHRCWVRFLYPHGALCAWLRCSWPGLHQWGWADYARSIVLFSQLQFSTNAISKAASWERRQNRSDVSAEGFCCWHIYPHLLFGLRVKVAMCAWKICHMFFWIFLKSN